MARVYVDNARNRQLGRVGKPYGSTASASVQDMLFSDEGGTNRNAAPSSSTSAEVKNERGPRRPRPENQRGRRSARQIRARAAGRRARQSSRQAEQGPSRSSDEQRSARKNRAPGRGNPARTSDALKNAAGKLKGLGTLKGIGGVVGRAAPPVAAAMILYDVLQDFAGVGDMVNSQSLRRRLEEDAARDVYTSRNPIREGDELARELEFLANMAEAQNTGGRYEMAAQTPGLARTTVDDLLNSGAFG